MAAGTCSNMGLQYLDPKDRSDNVRGGIFRSTCTADCALRVEAMLSTAILHQEDIICNLLLLISPELGTTDSCQARESFFKDCGTVPPTATVEVSPKFLIAMKTKLEMAMEWSQLAQLRLQGVLDNSKQHAVNQFSPSSLNTRCINGSAQEVKYHHL